ncbi:MAG: ABC transporter ATP-binding protein [Hydrogenophilus sp.]|nr:ABC transporter ATP-binding protein [Hydrogenophilus sp.]
MSQAHLAIFEGKGAQGEREKSIPLVALRGVTRVFGKGEAAVWALRGVDLSIEEGEFVALMGPSGSGKSTCLSIIGCLDTPSSGDYRLAGVEVGRLGDDGRALVRRYFLGFVFQGFYLLPRLTALENVELPLVYHGVGRRERRERARAALAAVGLSGREQHRPSELSGGQQQRVAIARAIVTQPRLLLADEPTGNLDSAMSHEIMTLFSSLHQQGLTVVMVTHEADVAAYAARVVRFRDGRIEEDSGVG